jgi:hypothetical protein
LIFARASAFVLDALDRPVPAWTLAEIGERLGPGGLVLDRLDVRRVVASFPGGVDLLRERLRARRAAAKPVPLPPKPDPGPTIVPARVLPDGSLERVLPLRRTRKRASGPRA